MRVTCRPPCRGPRCERHRRLDLDRLLPGTAYGPATRGLHLEGFLVRPPPEVQVRRTRARPPERRSRATRLDELAQQLLPMQRPSGTAPEGSPLLSSGVSRSSVEAPIFWSVGARTQQRRGSTSPPSYGNTQAPVYESAWLASVSLAVQIAICQKPRTTVTA